MRKMLLLNAFPSRLAQPIAAALVLAAAGTAMAQTPALTMPPAATAGAAATTNAALPAEQSSGNVRWRCGGIGSDESTALRAAMREHPLSLLFARPDGAYLADVQVEVKPEGAGAATASWRATGPVCVVQLPPGKYTVVASFEGKQQRHSVQIGGAPRTLDFRF